MLIDIAHAVGGYLHDVFIGNVDWGILIGYYRADVVRHALRRAVDCLRARRQEAWCRPPSGCFRSAAD